MKKAIYLAIGALVDEVRAMVDEVVADVREIVAMAFVLFICGSGESVVEGLLSVIQ